MTIADKPSSSSSSDPRDGLSAADAPASTPAEAGSSPSKPLTPLPAQPPIEVAEVAVEATPSPAPVQAAPVQAAPVQPSPVQPAPAQPDSQNAAPPPNGNGGNGDDGNDGGGNGNGNGGEETIDLAAAPRVRQPRVELNPYNPEKRRDYVRLIVTVGLLAMLGWVVVWACLETRSWNEKWQQTKEMLQIVLPALIGLIGSVIGFYFGSNSPTSGGSSPARPATSP